MTGATATLLSPSDRDLVLRAMSGLCAERGYAETAVAEIVARAGVSEQTFHELFADKEECAIGAVNAILGEVMSVFASSYSADLSEWDSIVVGIRAILELMAANPSFAYISYITARQMATPRVQEAREPGVRLLRAMLERLWAYAEDRPQPAAVPIAALGGAEAAVRRALVSGQTEELPRLLPDFVYAAAVPFLGQEEALRLARRGRELLRGSRWGP
jgi:AcrR family transcriptional regulator